MLTTMQYIEIRLPALYSLSGVSTYIEMAQARLSASALGSRYNEAVALLAMHLYTVDKRGSGTTGGIMTGPVSSMSEGQLSVSFDNSISGSSLASQFSSYQSTLYGKELTDLIQSTVIGVRNRTV